MPTINEILSPETQAIVLQALVLASLLTPVLERLAAKTATKIDDRLVAALKTLLALVPRVRLGGGK